MSLYHKCSTPSTLVTARQCFHSSSVAQGTDVVEFLEHGATVSAKNYRETLTELRKEIKLKRPGKLSRGVILLHDDAIPTQPMQKINVCKSGKS
ncbi:hypothetical protein AVEN_254303-1 [Araneus ventricosus]|uniref:Uncharacterized protein n=1 Tax=Araneus ventricosus TaxID=182803 RepID=A0A4Y2FCJ8_ARAVE|nr:hypothetical protein AVEN_254303-1 [Araneus ventricosus]